MPLDDDTRKRLNALLARDTNPGAYDEHWAPTPPARSVIANMLMGARDRVPENPNTGWSAVNMLRGGLEHGANSMDVAGGYRDPSTMSAFDAPMGFTSAFARPRAPISPIDSARDAGYLRSAGDLSSSPHNALRTAANENSAGMVSANWNHQPYASNVPGSSFADAGAMRTPRAGRVDRPLSSTANDTARDTLMRALQMDEATMSARAYLRAANGDKAEASRIALRNAQEEGTPDATAHAWMVIRLLNLSN